MGQEQSSSGADQPGLFIRLLQTLDVDLIHLQERIHHSLRLLSIVVLHHLEQNRGNDRKWLERLVRTTAVSTQGFEVSLLIFLRLRR